MGISPGQCNGRADLGPHEQKFEVGDTTNANQHGVWSTALARLRWDPLDSIAGLPDKGISADEAFLSSGRWAPKVWDGGLGSPLGWGQVRALPMGGTRRG